MVAALRMKIAQAKANAQPHKHSHEFRFAVLSCGDIVPSTRFHAHGFLSELEISIQLQTREDGSSICLECAVSSSDNQCWPATGLSYDKEEVRQ